MVVAKKNKKLHFPSLLLACEIDSQSLEDMQVGYILQKYTLDNYILEKYTLAQKSLATDEMRKS